MKHLLLEILESTEAAAIAAYKLVGTGDKNKIDLVATEAIRNCLNKIEFGAEIVIGEGIKDKSEGLFKGEIVGKSKDIKYDVAIDPVDGTSQTMKYGNEAMSVIAIGEKNHLFPAEEFYMEKIAVGSKCVSDNINFLNNKELVNFISDKIGKKQITVCMLDRPRHQDLANEMRSLGCRIKFIQDCDVSGAIAVALPKSNVDLFIGIGGAPEGVITAAAMKCLGGQFIGRLVDNKTYKPIDDKIYSQGDLAKGDVMFAATGILNGSLLKGVRYEKNVAITHSVLMESATKTVKYVESYH